jgi:site-specific recombinase XerD
MKPRRKLRSITFLTPDEVLSVLRVARKRSLRDWAMLIMVYSHGLRAQEAANLTVRDLDLKGQQISIRRLKGSLHTVQPVMGHKGQPLLDEQKALREWLAIRPQFYGDALFVSQKGGPLSATQVYRIFRDIAIEAGLPKTKQHPHCLKHSLASHLVAQNVNLARVKQYLGHAAISSTMRYVAVSDQEASRDAANALQNTF